MNITKEMEDIILKDAQKFTILCSSGGVTFQNMPREISYKLLISSAVMLFNLVRKEFNIKADDIAEATVNGTITKDYTFECSLTNEAIAFPRCKTREEYLALLSALTLPYMQEKHKDEPSEENCEDCIAKDECKQAKVSKDNAKTCSKDNHKYH